MRIKKGFMLREVCGESVVTGESIEQVDFNKLITLNVSAVYLWKAVEGTDFDEHILASLLQERYRVSRVQALEDAAALCAAWKEAGVAE